LEAFAVDDRVLRSRTIVRLLTVVKSQSHFL
jgi:hypothetical protein